jgi:hypothetical protein
MELESGVAKYDCVAGIVASLEAHGPR